jgi:hypothetical protein
MNATIRTTAPDEHPCYLQTVFLASNRGKVKQAASSSSGIKVFFP